MVILKHIFVIVSKSFRVLHCNQKRIINTSKLKNVTDFILTDEPHRNTDKPKILPLY